MFNKKIWMLIAVTVISDGLHAQSNTESNLIKKDIDGTKSKIELVINSYVTNHAFAGTILVSKSGNIIFKKAYGFKDRAKNLSLTITDSFLLASLSKPITATMVLMLEEQGKLKLDATLADYFPEFNNAIGKKITLHHLLNHTSGIPNHFVIDGWFDASFHKKTSEQQFVELIAELSPKFEPGEDDLYSNLGYFLLGKIIEKTTKISFSASLQNYIFAPLNMKNSGVVSGLKLTKKIVKGYRWNDNGGYREQAEKNMTLFGAGAAIFSNIDDLYLFDLALYSDKLLKTESKNRLFNSEKAYSWRVGRVQITPSHEVNIHTYNGQFDGYSSMMTRFVDDQHSIILLSNVGVSYFLKQQLTFDIAAVLYDHDIPDRKYSAALALIKNMVSGEFNKTLNNMGSNKNNLVFNQQSLSALAFQLLWSDIGDKSLELFSFISHQFPDSSTAKKNLLQACEHRLAKNSKNRSRICD